MVIGSRCNKTTAIDIPTLEPEISVSVFQLTLFISATGGRRHWANNQFLTRAGRGTRLAAFFIRRDPRHYQCSPTEVGYRFLSPIDMRGLCAPITHRSTTA
jgi:hypothetical protein